MKRLMLFFLLVVLLLPWSSIAAPPVPYYVGKFAGDGLALSNVTAVALSSNTINLAASSSIGITTNSAVVNTPYLTASQTNSWRVDATNAAASKVSMNGGSGTNLLLEGLTTATNLTTTTFRPTVGVASTVAAFNASTNIYSIGNGAGFLANDGGGAFTWQSSLNASNLSGTIPNGSIPGWVASGTDVVNATNGLLRGVTGSGSALATTNGSGVVNIAVTGSGGDVLAAGQNNFSGSNYFGGRTYFVSTMDIEGALRIANGSAIITNGAIAGGIRVFSGTINDLGTGVLPVPSNAPAASDVLTATSASTAAWQAPSTSAGAVTNGDTRTIGVAGLIVSNTITASEFDVGTLVVTNPPALNLLNSTNYQGSNVVGAVASATTATYVSTSPLTNNLSGNATTATTSTYVTTSPLTNNVSGNATTATTSTYVTTSPLTNNVSGNATTATAATNLYAGFITNSAGVAGSVLPVPTNAPVTGYVPKATSATTSAWQAESGGSLGATNTSGELILTNDARLTISGPNSNYFAGIMLSNVNVATVNTQQYSPSIELYGNGWKTTSTAGTEPILFRQFVTPIQDTTHANLMWELDYSKNGATPVSTLQVVGPRLGASEPLGIFGGANSCINAGAYPGAGNTVTVSGSIVYPGAGLCGAGGFVYRAGSVTGPSVGLSFDNYAGNTKDDVFYISFAQRMGGVQHIESVRLLPVGESDWTNAATEVTGMAFLTMNKGTLQESARVSGYGNIVVTNGIVYPQIAAIPTNCIPSSSASGTNWWVGTVGGILEAVMTNYAAGGFITKQIAP